MSNQEMLFSDPEWRPPQQQEEKKDSQEQEAFVPRPINTDPREQPQQFQQPVWQPPQPREEPYMQPGAYPSAGPQQMVGERVRPRPRRRGPGPWFWIILVLIILALSGVGRMGFGGFGFHNSVTDTAHNFTVQGLPIVVINDDVGTIRVHTGNTGEVDVTATKQSEGMFGNPNNIHIDYGQNKSTITVNVDGGSGFFSSGKVDLDVTVPMKADLQLQTNTGEIDVTGVDGQMSLQTDTGTINATQDELMGQSLLKTDTGAVTFNGSLDTTGAYRFEANTGAVNVTLPGNSAFHLDASSDTGSINSSFPGVQENVQHPDNTSSNVSVDVGINPQSTVTLKTDTGAINLNTGG